MEKREEEKPIKKELGGTLSFSGNLDISKIHTYIQKNIFGIIVLIVIALISSFIGNIVHGSWGIVISLVLNFLGIVVGCYAIIKVRQIDHYINN